MTFYGIWAKSRIPWDAEISVHMVATGSDAYITPNRRCEEDAFTYCAASQAGIVAGSADEFLPELGLSGALAMARFETACIWD